ncbi:MAG: hypothetical protein DRO99_04580 [Candidatus Aenigmatarchaeota archaeon]|nr:MAG: hypothetical protein DRO99_04580 [Candidatus Aenigmarchaeota archaeon]
MGAISFLKKTGRVLAAPFRLIMCVASFLRAILVIALFAFIVSVALFFFSDGFRAKVTQWFGTDTHAEMPAIPETPEPIPLVEIPDISGMERELEKDVRVQTRMLAIERKELADESRIISMAKKVLGSHSPGDVITIGGREYSYEQVSNDLKIRERRCNGLRESIKERERRLSLLKGGDDQ